MAFFRKCDLSSVLALFLFLAPSLGWAAPSLVVVDSSRPMHGLQQQMARRFQVWALNRSLGNKYDHIDYVLGEEVKWFDVVQKIELRSKKNRVDLLMLFGGGNSEEILRNQARFLVEVPTSFLSRLRLVYSASPISDRWAAEWRRIGAGTVLGQSNYLGESRLMFARFFSAWNQGNSVERAMEVAINFATSAEHQIEALPGSTEGRSAFGELSSQVIQSLFPQVRFDSSRSPSAKVILEDAGEVIWSQLLTDFPAVTAGLSGDSESVWIDGEGLRYLLEPLLGSVGGSLGEKLPRLLSKLDGIRISRTSQGMGVNAYFTEELSLDVVDPEAAKLWQLYRVSIPRAVRFQLNLVDGVVRVEGLDEGVSTLRLLIKSPSFLPDSVWLRSFQLNLESGAVEVLAGVMGNSLALLARGDLWARKLDGVDFWESLSRNFKLIGMPDLFFNKKE